MSEKTQKLPFSGKENVFDQQICKSGDTLLIARLGATAALAVWRISVKVQLICKAASKSDFTDNLIMKDLVYSILTTNSSLKV